MTDTTIEDTDNVKAFVERSEPPLAELRQKMLDEIGEIKEWIGEYDAGIAIGISPTDKVLNDLTRGEVTELITKIFERIRERGVDGALRPVGPLSLLLVGEYSPKHRWHYHGLIKVNNILTLDHIKKRLQKVVGRTITENIHNTVDYVNYMFKQYECPEHGMFYKWDNKECIVRVDRDENGKVLNKTKVRKGKIVI